MELPKNNVSYDVYADERPSTYPGVGNVQGVWDKLYL